MLRNRCASAAATKGAMPASIGLLRAVHVCSCGGPKPQYFSALVISYRPKPQYFSAVVIGYRPKPQYFSALVISYRLSVINQLSVSQLWVMSY